MQIVIEIPKSWLVDMTREEFIKVDALCQRILDGTPLPEHHGRLIDADAIKKKYFKSDRVYLGDDVVQILNIAPTIIPATKEGE